MAIPPFKPYQPIPNNPFYSANADRYDVYSETGVLIFGTNILVDYSSGTISIVPDGQRGTVINLTGTNGLFTTNSDIISRPHTVTVALATNPNITPASYSYPLLSVDPYGKIASIVSKSSGITSLTGTAPIVVLGTNPTVSIKINQASITAKGAVQLLDDTISPDNKRALTANQGFLLQQQLNVAANNLADQKLGGLLNAVSGNITKVTPDGATFPGIVAGSPLPAASATYDGLYFYIENTGTYTPPGGSATAVVPNDKVLCLAGAWVIIEQGVRLVPATTTVAGISTLATGVDVQALTDPSKFVTPGSLSVMVASTTQVGFVELATDAEAQAFTDTTRAITASNLDSVRATTGTRGIVQLSDSLADPSVDVAVTANAVRTYLDSTINNSIITAKSDMIVGFDTDQPIALNRGSNNSQLVVDTTLPAQGSLDWTIPDSIASWPLGAIIWNLTQTIPTLWLPCDGRLLDGTFGTPYYDLFEVIGTTFNTGGEPPNYFRIPDLRGEFVRGWNSSGGTAGALDPGRLFASTQSSAYQQHLHGLCDPGHYHDITPFQHCHATNAAQHCHAIQDQFHCHKTFTSSVSEVGDGGGTWYDGNDNKGGTNLGSAKTGISITSARTNLAISPSLSGINKTQFCTTGLTVTNPSPPTAPSPNETRPYNIALIPIIRYANV